VSYDGKNVGLYLEELRDLLERYPGLDGIYFDGVYPRSVKNTYIVCRAVRELIGDERILEIHCTGNAPGGLCYNPATDTWADFILRGEGQGFRSQNWLRFYVSCYNISNAIGVVCNNAGYWAPTQEQVEMTLRANARLALMPWIREEFTREQWETNVRGVGHEPNYGPAKEIRQRHDYAMENWYWPRLNRKLPAWVRAINQQLFASGKTAPPQLADPPYPLLGLTEEMLQSAQQGWLVMDSFGADAPEYLSPMTLNGVGIGPLPPPAGDQWTSQIKAVLPAEVLRSLQAKNRLIVQNPARDCFKLRNVYLVVVLDDGQRASSKVVRSAYCSADSWAHSEGFGVPIGESLTIELPIPLE